MGLDNVSFSEISVGERLHTYNYTSTGFEESWLTYPLFCNNNLFAVARETSGGHFQITTALAEKIRESGKSNVAIVYDVNSCYLMVQISHCFKKLPQKLLPDFLFPILRQDRL